MGNDGGSINKTKNLVLINTRNKDFQNDDRKEFAHYSIWSICRLSNKKLELPLVSDYMGNLFNKEAVLEWLLNPLHDNYTDEQIKLFNHIKSLRDIVDLCNLSQDESSGNLVAMVTDEILGKSTKKFIYLSTCGDVLPHNMTEHVNKCPICSKPFTKLDIIQINPITSDERILLQERMNILRNKNLYHNGIITYKKKAKRKSPSGDIDSTKRRKK